MSPQIIAAVMVLIIGWTIGRIAGKAFSKAFTKTGLDVAVKKTAVGKAIERSGVTSVVFFDRLIRWSIYLLTILAAIDLMKIEAASLFIQKISDYLPQFIGGVFVLFVGLIISDFIGNAVRSLGAELEFSALLAGALKILLYFIVTVTALSVMQIDVSILRTFANAMAWGVAIAFGIAFGLGFKDYIAKNAERWIASAASSSKKDQSGES